MAPLIDIVFLTLVFFMVTSVYGALESEVDITLPTADSAVQSERNQGEIFINLRSDGVIVVNEQEHTVEELQTLLYRVAELFPGGAVIIRGDQTAQLGRAIQILDCCRKADIQNVSFAAWRAWSRRRKKLVPLRIADMNRLVWTLVLVPVMLMGSPTHGADADRAAQKLNFANGLFQRSFFDEAVEEYLAYIEAVGEAAVPLEVWYHLGEAAYAAKNYDRALESFTQLETAGASAWRDKAQLSGVRSITF